MKQILDSFACLEYSKRSVHTLWSRAATNYLLKQVMGGFSPVLFHTLAGSGGFSPIFLTAGGMDPAPEALGKGAANKSPGPDGLQLEFYRTFKTLMLPRWTDMYRELMSPHTPLPSAFLEGMIIPVPKPSGGKGIQDYPLCYAGKYETSLAYEISLCTSLAIYKTFSDERYVQCSVLFSTGTEESGIVLNVPMLNRSPLESKTKLDCHLKCPKDVNSERICNNNKVPTNSNMAGYVAYTSTANTGTGR